MKPHRQKLAQDVLVFGLLVAIGVAGRWNEPEWCFTPTAAAAIFAGYYFASWPVAIMVPLAILGMTDLLLPAHDNLPVMLVTYAAMTVPVWLGRVMSRRREPAWHAAGGWAICGLFPATLFFVATNFAVWAFQSDYEKSFSGLVHCYWAALPFYRWMLAGDVFYLSVLLVCLALAQMGAQSAELASVEEIRE